MLKTIKMNKITLTEILVYPIKSTAGIFLEKALVENTGLPYDRSFAVIGRDNKIITGRENPRLLNIRTKIENNILELSAAGRKNIQLALDKIPVLPSLEAGIFSDLMNVLPITHAVNNWLSTVIEEPVRLVKSDPDAERKMKARHHSKEQDVVLFCDVAPVHLISESSLSDLNARLEQPVSSARFRPNLIVRGCEAYAENAWKKVVIGDCIFDVAIKTVRCNFITIDPKTTETHPRQEPLRTLSRMRKEKGEVTFGIYLIPRKLGTVKKGDLVSQNVN